MRQAKVFPIFNNNTNEVNMNCKLIAIFKLAKAIEQVSTNRLFIQTNSICQINAADMSMKYQAWISFVTQHTKKDLRETFLHELFALSDQQMPSATNGFRHAGNPDEPYPFAKFIMNAHISNIPASLLNHYLAAKLKELSVYLNEKRFWWVENSDQVKVMIYDSFSRLLWDVNPDVSNIWSSDYAKLRAATLTIDGISGWRLPNNNEIVLFSREASNPLRSGIKNRLLGIIYCCTSESRIDLDDFGIAKSSLEGNVLACNDFFADAKPEHVIRTAMQRSWSLRATDINDSTDICQVLRNSPDLKTVYQDVDYLSALLPKLDSAQFTDQNKGVWELWGLDPELLARQCVRARNPALDVRDWNVAIDFGTSSTVVAYDDNDQHKLLRIGVGDYWQDLRSEHYENPTVLEFIDFKGLFDTWQSETYRPGVQWDQVHCSHAALQNFRNNKSNPRVVGSILPNIKQWALREADASRIHLTDRNEPEGVEHELAPLTLRLPVKDQALTVSPQTPFDPIELYAWFLGLAINWRGRGICLRYLMTFPIAYPRAVKENILASFSRGLQRSLPASLIAQPVFQKFTVEERASEPAAYAASAMPCLGIDPTTAGLAYAVFDFGGGTTDFDFGYYRLPTADEADEGKEKVFEHFGAAGDRFLGGENLLENLAYRVFRHNLDICGKNKVAFTRPLDADDFAGSEMFLEQTQAALTNTVMLMARLRPLWEGGSLNSSPQTETLDLLDREGHEVSCQLTIPIAELTTYLEQRIEQGVRNFLAALKKAFVSHLPEQVHVLLAGNASRSRWVLDAFGVQDDEENAVQNQISERIQRYALELFAEQMPKLTVHEPLPVDKVDLFKPTAKTGVALGLLQLCQGSVIKVINRAKESANDEAPFAHYVGRIRQGKFLVCISQGSVYGHWQELGTPSECVFNLYHTQLPSAYTGAMKQGESGLIKLRLDLVGTSIGHKVFARVIGPSEIELCTASSPAAIEQGDRNNPMSLLLRT